MNTSNTWGLSLTKNGSVILALNNASTISTTHTVSVSGVSVAPGDVLSVQIRTAVPSYAVVESGAVTYLEASSLHDDAPTPHRVGAIRV
ncbi:hypothetical protein GS580_28180 [Rhodococcus hoagii]|nr:hypothetical protein [Prescottella equi]